MEICLIEDARKLEQKRLNKKNNHNLPSIKHEIYNQTLNNVTEDQKNRTMEAERKLENLHKEINVSEIFDKFKNIVTYNSNICKKSELDIIRNKNQGKKLFSKINDTSFLHHGKNGYLPKIKHKKLEKINELNSENWSPIDNIISKDIKNKSKLDKTKGFSIKNRQINFKKNDSIFLTNNNNTASNVLNPTKEVTNSVTNNSIFDQNDTLTENINFNTNNRSINPLSFPNLLPDKSIISNNNKDQSVNISIFDFDN